MPGIAVFYLIQHKFSAELSRQKGLVLSCWSMLGRKGKEETRTTVLFLDNLSIGAISTLL